MTWMKLPAVLLLLSVFARAAEPSAVLAARLRTERVQLKQREYLASLVKSNPVAVNEIELSKIRPSPVKTGN